MQFRVLATIVLTLCLVNSVAAQELKFVRGDGNGDGLLNVADVVYCLQHLFHAGPSPCAKAMDANDDGSVNVADAVYTLVYLFGGGATPSAPFPDCDLDPTSDSLSCLASPRCDLGGPIDGLSDVEIIAFNNGKLLFEKEFKRSDGVGPFFNAASCAACHNTPLTGGSAPNYRNFYLAAIGFPGAQFPIQDPLLPSLVLPSFAPVGEARPRVPDEFAGLPIVLAQRNAPPMFGTGLFEFVSNGEILSNADPDDTITPDGISGRFNTDGFGNIGRFGYKLQANSIEPFIRGASMNQMGLTTNPVLGSGGVVNLAASALLQIGSPLDSPTMDTDGIPDPEISVADFADVIAFSRFIRPPDPKPFTAAALNGETLFTAIGCSKCHVPTLMSSLGPVNAYTDLLLHDLGPELADGIAMGIPQASSLAPATTESEFRTQPLWGVRFTGPFLHDGRAGTLHDAIVAHGGEAELVRVAYDNLSQQDKDYILEFLESL